MSGDDETESDSHHSPVNQRNLSLIFIFVFLFFLIWKASVGIGSEIGSLAPLEYGSNSRIDVAMTIIQVSVLYFAVLVASFRFMDNSDQFSLDQNILFVTVVCALLSVSGSAVFAIFQMLKLFNFALFVSLVLMGVAFLLSLFAPVVAIWSDVTETEAESQESRVTLEDFGPDRDETSETERETE